jgi:hypothetical protein
VSSLASAAAKRSRYNLRLSDLAISNVPTSATAARRKHKGATSLASDPNWDERLTGIARFPPAWIHFSTLLGTSAEIIWKQSVSRALSDFRRQARRHRDNRPGSQGSARKSRKRIMNLEMHRVFMMLSGLAIETALKGMRVKQAAGSGEVLTVVKKGQLRLGEDFATHDLGHLAATVGFKCTQKEADLLDCLKVYVEWAGRYPISRRPSSFTGGPIVCWKDVLRLARRLKTHYDRM